MRRQQEAQGRLRRLGTQQWYRSCWQRTCLYNKLHRTGVSLDVRNKRLVQHRRKERLVE